MKALLILCLIVSLNCNILDIGMWLFSNEKLRNVVGDVIKSIKEKNFVNILSLFLTNFNEVKSIVVNCFNDEPVLKYYNNCSYCGRAGLPAPDYWRCLERCKNKPKKERYPQDCSYCTKKGLPYRNVLLCFEKCRNRLKITK